MARGKRLARLTRDEHMEAARFLCGAVNNLIDGLKLVGKAVGAERLDIGLKAERTIDVRLCMHLQDAWDDDFGPEGNPYRAAVDERTETWYAERGIKNLFPKDRAAPVAEP